MDGTLDAFPCHGASGFVGTVLTGLFVQECGLFYGGGWRLLGVQLVAVVATFAYSAAVSAVLYGSRFMRMRVSASEELVGLDDVAHCEKAYSPSKAYLEASPHTTSSEKTSGQPAGSGESADTNVTTV